MNLLIILKLLFQETLPNWDKYAESRRIYLIM